MLIVARSCGAETISAVQQGVQIFMKKGDIVEGKVIGVSFPNKGRVLAEGETITVKNVLPGQLLKVRIRKKRGGKYEGTVQEVTGRSPLETRAPRCPLCGRCGGCSCQTLEREQQLALKETQIRELLSPVVPDFENIFDGIRYPEREFYYRNKMEYTFGDTEKGGSLTLGLHRRGAYYDILSADCCALVHADFNLILRTVLEYCQEQKLPYYRRMTHQGYLRHLLVRRSEKGDIMAAVVTTTQFSHDFTELAGILTRLPLEGRLTGVLHMENDLPADMVQSEKTTILYGIPDIEEELLGLRFRVSPFSFFQTNTNGAELLYRTVRELTGSVKDAVIFDLYSGTGTIAQVLSPAAKRVIGIEIVEEAVCAARENAEKNGIANCEFIAGDVLEVISGLDVTPDYIILDPPRDGIPPKTLGKIIQYNARRVIYVSCKPTSLARDLPAFFAGGYQVERIVCVDMFPQTAHVETVCLMSKVRD